MLEQRTHFLEYWQTLMSVLENLNKIDLRGGALTISDVVVVSQYKIKVNVDDLPQEIVAKIDRSVQFLHQSLEEGRSVYGVNTGFGGSADTSTTAADTLQVALLQMQLSAVLPLSNVDRIKKDKKVFQHQLSILDGIDSAILSMPESWVRGAMLVRCNSLLRGHPAVRLDVIKSILKFLENDLVPLVPLRGSLSASGDLCPLSYIAGALEGNSDVRVWWGDGSAQKLIPADQALKHIGLTPVQFGPKETLGLLNGTAFSLSVAALAHHEAEILAILAQILTAMGVEALLGTAESFDSFIAAVRPHPGQTDVAHNIRAFLEESKLARFDHALCSSGHLRQDRYALSSQWLGPGLEDKALSRSQLEIELNSTTNNPLIDVGSKQIHHGGNFQALSVTSSTEKTRTALEKIGRLIFAQSSELLGSRLAYNLPPNLAVDEPSLSYSMKGVDINMASYMSELAYIANPVSNHVHSAEMSNQSLNSLALISARYTHTAMDLVSLMSSAYLYCLCQALDLRAMDARFMARLKPEVEELTLQTFSGFVSSAQLSRLHIAIWKTLQDSLATSASKDSSERFLGAAQEVQHIVVGYVGTSTTPPPKPLDIIATWTATLANTLENTFNANRTSYLANPDATSYLGKASKIMYLFVRNKLGVPMHRGIVDHPNFGSGSLEENMKKSNTGSRISCIYQAIKDGRIVGPILDCLRNVRKVGGNGVWSVGAKL
ncbi:hypothetical protein IFR05_016070 [Cadophora sp. M221]|nr:hypothetical protein IFR05_016070 [Cadophora sp. M221]